MKRCSRTELFLLVVVVAAAGLPTALAGSGPVTDGRVWLEGDQNADGSWGAVLPTVVTGSALESLTTLDACALPIVPGADWLSSQETDNHDFLARQIMGLSGATGFESTARSLALDLLSLRNPVEPNGALPNWPEGGWGIANGFETDCQTTAVSLFGLDRAGFNGGFARTAEPLAASTTNVHQWEIPADAIKVRIQITITGSQIRLRMTEGAPPTIFDPFFALDPGLNYLITLPDSLPFTPGTNFISIESPDPPGLAASYTMTASYETATFDTRTLAEPLSYLRESQNVDGGWGLQRGQTSELYTTLHALLALEHYSQYDFATEIAGAASYVKSLQLGDGSFGFGGSPVSYVTALAALGLVRSETPPFSTETEDAVTALLAQQAGNGSWDQEAYDTSLAMLALREHDLPPTADAGPDQAVTDADVSCSEDVTLSGLGSSPDGAIVGFSWTEDCVVFAAVNSPTVSLPVGTHRLVLTVTADDGQTAQDAVTVTVDGVPVDLDLDGFLACTQDCDDGNGIVHAAPDEARNLRVVTSGDLSWDPPADLGGLTLVYDVLRSDDPSDFVNATVCLETDDGSDTAAQDLDLPAAGSIFYYLPRAENDCPAGEGPLGNDSAGASRSGRTCI